MHVIFLVVPHASDAHGELDLPQNIIKLDSGNNDGHKKQ